MKAKIIGHQKILKYFDKVVENGNLSHAYCFVGPDQVGKKTVAKAIGAKLLNVESAKLVSQPDFREISEAVDEKTGKTKKDISILQLRQTASFFSEYAFLGGYKIVIIDPADKMSLAAANGLLKTLEEPRKNTLLFLITVDESRLPQTIQSRCQMIYFSAVGVGELASFLEGQGQGREKAAEMASLSRGLPGQAIQWVEDKGTYQSYQDEVNRFESLQGVPFYDKLKKVEDLLGDKSDHILARTKLQKVLSLWQMLVRDHLLYARGEREYRIHQVEGSGDTDVAQFLNIEKMILVARQRLQQNIHPRLLIENILIHIP